MRRNNRKPIFLLFLMTLIAVISVGLLAGYFYMRDYAKQIFGPPVPEMTLTQQILFPLELFFNRNDLTAPTDIEGIEQTFTIDQGESVSLVSLRLEQEGLINDAELFRTYLIYSGFDRLLQAGDFKLSATMSPVEIAAELLDATPDEAVVTILPGWRVEEVAANVAGSGLKITAEEFITAAYAPSSMQLSYLAVGEPTSLEGYFSPGTYIFPREADLNTVLETVLSAFAEKMDDSLVDGFERKGLTVSEAVTLASVIEKEAVLDDEKPLIASVFFNRLAAGMRLETDPTVQYALGYQSDTASWWKTPLTAEDMAIDSPYNTYLYFGLPSSPISNPDLISLRAVAFPAETPYYYFRAACDGSGGHNFAITYEEHLDNACE